MARKAGGSMENTLSNVGVNGGAPSGERAIGSLPEERPLNSLKRQGSRREHFPAVVHFVIMGGRLLLRDLAPINEEQIWG